MDEMTNVVEVTEDVVEATVDVAKNHDFGKGFGVGALVTAGAGASVYFGRKLWKKLKAKKAAKAEVVEAEDFVEEDATEE